MTQKEASIILNVSTNIIKSFVINNKLKLDDKGKLLDESVYELKKDLEERRSITKPVWIERNLY
jgi:hypothetical protein